MALTDGILAYWKLDDSSWVDSTGNGYTLGDYDATVVNGDGIILNGMVSDGTAYFLTNPYVSVGASYSVSLWANVIANYDSLDCIWNLGGVNGPAGVANNGTTYFFLGNVEGEDYNLPDIGGLTAGWNHLCYVIDNAATTQSFYVNGVFQNGEAYNGDFGEWTGFELGAFYGRGIFSNSHLDEVGIWNRALSNTDVSSLYNSGIGKSYPFVYAGTLYYNNAQEDGDWGNILNWWTDDAFTIQATDLPTTDNPVNLYNEVTQNTIGPAECFCSSASFWSANFAFGLTLQSTGVVNMQGSSVMAGHSTDGVSMHDSSTLASTSVVDGDVTMRGASRAYGTILGNATVYYDNGDGQYPIGGTVFGSVTYIGFNFGQTCYFSQIEDGLLGNVNNWFLDSERTILASFVPDDRNDVVFSGMETIVGITGGAEESITYKSISANGVVFSGIEINPFTLVATDGITAIDSLFRQVTIQADGLYTNCNFADDQGAANLAGNIVLRSCIGIYTHDEDPPMIANFIGNVNAYYPTQIASGSVTGTIARHGYGLRNTCTSHCHLDETSGTREFLDLYEEVPIVISGAGVGACNGTYTRVSSIRFNGPNGFYISNTSPTSYVLKTSGGSSRYNSSDAISWTSVSPSYNPAPTGLVQPITVGYGTGLIDNAAKFDGNALINDPYQLAVEFSVSVWVRFPVVPTGSSDCIVGTGQTYGENFTIYGTASKLVVYFESSGQPDLQSDPISADTWYHCVLTVTTNSIKFYVNGEYIGQKTDIAVVNAGGFALSKFYNGNTLHDDALVDELNIFNISLSQSQINKLYNNGLGLGYPFTIAGAKKIDLYKLLGIPFPAKDYKYSRLTNLPFFVKI